jgi:hypothetical protein
MHDSIRELLEEQTKKIFLSLYSGRLPLPIAPKWLTPEQAAQHCGLTKKALEHHRLAGTGPRRGGPSPRVIRYDRTELDAWMERGVVDPTK